MECDIRTGCSFNAEAAEAYLIYDEAYAAYDAARSAYHKKLKEKK